METTTYKWKGIIPKAKWEKKKLTTPIRTPKIKKNNPEPMGF